MSTKLIVFDCDGVLRSVSWIGLFEAYKAICAYLGLNYALFFSNVDEFSRWFNSDWRKNLFRFGLENKNVYPKISHIFHEVYDPYIEIFSWTNRVLREVSFQCGVAVLSTSLSSSVAESLYEVRKHIDMLVGCDHVKKIKPNPEGLELIMRKLDVSPEETWIVGDTISDIQSGQRAGIRTSIVTWGLSDEEEVPFFGADKILKNHEEIFSLL